MTTTATFNARDQLTSRGSVTYSYDPNGNQTASSAGQALAYNAANGDHQPQASRGHGPPRDLRRGQPGGAGQRRHHHLHQHPPRGERRERRRPAGLHRRLHARPAGGLVGIRGANRSYYLFGGLGSVVAVTNSSGSVTNSYTYDPHGVTTETKAALTNVINPWRYAGQYQDVSTTGLYKMGARYHQPELGRWTQRDPSGQDANAYACVAGNPVNFVDPSGLAVFGIDCPAGKTDSGGCNGADDARGVGSVVDDAADGSVQGSGYDFAAGAIAGCGIGLVAGPSGCVAAGGAFGTNTAVIGAVVGAAAGAFFGDRK